MSNNSEIGNIAFDLPKNQSNVIKVIGVGGGGSNAINHMFQQGIKGVDFVICNTDAQALQNSGVPNKIQLGVNLTEGLGAGANPDIGEKAAIESIEDIRAMLETNTKMVFITAGMGGGTGTGAAPVIAKMAKELNILTVGIVTMPFQFEGKIRLEQAQKGIENLRMHVDSLIVINNNKLREVYGNLGFKAGFSKADEVLSTASRGIAEVITHHYTQNIDLRDAKTVLSNSGTAIMGSATASGKSRAQEAIMKALDSPLLNDNKITGAKNVLLLIVSGTDEITIDEIGEINDHIQNEAGHGANIIMGVGEDESLEDSISVTIIATGFNMDQQNEISNTETKRVVHELKDDMELTFDNKTQNETQKNINHHPQTPHNLNQTTAPNAHKQQQVVRHTLTEDLDDIDSPGIQNKMNLIPTTEFVKNINVVYDEVLDKQQQDDIDDFVITPVNTQEHPQEQIQEEQITLTFDLPLDDTPINPTPKSHEAKDDKIMFSLDDEIKDIEVHSAVEVTPVAETNSQEKIRYVLEDDEQTNAQHSSKAKEVDLQIDDEEIVFEKKVIQTPDQKNETDLEEMDPLNSPISVLLKERADERRRKLKDFNYKFNTAKINEIEKEPAYKRQGVKLDENPHSSETNASRMSISTDDNDDVQLRRNNSFLHDNVD